MSEKVHAHKPGFQNALANIMLYGVLISAAVMLVGGVIYLIHHGHQSRSALHINLFHGEPHALTSVVAIAKDALAGSDPCIIQFGVLLLLLNPLVRVAFAVVGYIGERDRMYAVISAIVFAVLLFSFFW